MSLLVVGLNHTTAPVAVRERVAFAEEQVPEALQRACEFGGATEVVILSTCNRTELIASTGPDAVAEERLREMRDHLAGVDADLKGHRDAALQAECRCRSSAICNAAKHNIR